MGKNKKPEITEIQAFFTYEMVKDPIVNFCVNHNIEDKEVAKLLAIVNQNIFNSFFIFRLLAATGHTLQRAANIAINIIYSTYFEVWKKPDHKGVIKTLKDIEKKYAINNQGAETSSANKSLADKKPSLENSSDDTTER